MADNKKIVDVKVLKEVRKKLDEKYDDRYLLEGEYSPETSVGKADQAKQIESKREIEDVEIACPPITFGIAGDEAEIQSGINKFEYLEGKSIKFNQLAPKIGENGTWTVGYGNTHIDSIVNGVATITVDGTNGRINCPVENDNAYVNSHKYLIIAEATNVTNLSIFRGDFLYLTKIDNSNRYYRFYTYQTLTYKNINLYFDRVTANPITISHYQIFDLTEIFGAGNEPTTYDNTKIKLLELGINIDVYYSLNNGTILSAKSSKLISRGKNQFSGMDEFIRVVPNEEYELSGISVNGILKQYDASKNLISTSDTITDTVHITMGENTHYVKITANTYENVMFYLTFPEDGGVYGEPYEEYEEHEVNLPNIELRSVGDVKDIAYASGGGRRRVGVETLDSAYAVGDTITISDIKADTTNITSNKGDLSLWGTISGTTITLTSALASGDVILYELAEETDIPLNENPGWNENLPVNNFGTLEYVTSPAQVPQVEQPYFIRYTVNLVEFLDTTYVKAKGDGNNLATQEEVDAIKDGKVVVGESKMAQNLTPYSDTSGTNDTTPFVFQTAGGNSDIGSKAYLRALRGNTIKWIQLVNHGQSTTTVNGITLTNNDNGSWTVSGTASANVGKNVVSVQPQLISGHKYLLKGCPVGGDGTKYFIDIGLTADKRDLGSGNIFVASSTTSVYVYISVKSGYAISGTLIFRPQLFDLTQIFGAGNEPTTVEKFNRSFPKPYYAYNAGQLLSVKPNGYKTVGYNAFDGELEIGYLDDTTGQPIINNANVIPTNYIRVIAGQTYTVEAVDSTNRNRVFYEYDSNYNLVRRTIVYYPTISLQLTENTQYVKFVYPNPDLTLKIAFYLTWDGSRTGFEFYHSETYALPNIELRSNPATETYDELKPDGMLITRVGIRDYASGDESDSTVTTDGTKTVYDLTTPTTEQTSYTFQRLTDIDDWGTQEILYDNDIAIPVPQPIEFFYPADYKAFIDSVGGRGDINYDAGEVVSKTQLANYLKTITGYDATKTQTLENVNGTFTWVDKE